MAIKPPKTYQEQLDILKSRGLTVNDPAYALHCLAHYNYYRLSAYRFVYTAHGNPDQFLPGTTFEQIFSLYIFDSQLRKLVMEACKMVEISVRSRLAYEIGHQLGPQAYLDNHNFSDKLIHARMLNSLDRELSRSNEEFVRHHRETLKLTWPPIWVLVEVISFGTMSNLLTQIKPASLRSSIARTYGIDEQFLRSIIHHLSIVRNTVAHHGRLWNRRLVVELGLPRTKPKHLLSNFQTDPAFHNMRKIYNTLVVLAYFCGIISPGSDWVKRLRAHIQTLTPSLIPHMGFPPDWQSRPIWT